MVGERALRPQLGGDLHRIALVAADAGNDLVAHPADRLVGEARLGQRHLQQLDAFRGVVGEHLQVAVEGVAVDGKGQPHRAVLQRGLEGLGIIRTGALVEQRREQVGHAGQVGRILRAAGALEGEVHHHHRHGVVGHQPGLDAARAGHLFDGDCPGGRGAGQRDRGGEAEGRERLAGAAGENGQHEEVSSPSGRAVGRRRSMTDGCEWICGQADRHAPLGAAAGFDQESLPAAFFSR